MGAAERILARAQKSHPQAPFPQPDSRVTDLIYEGPYSRIFRIDGAGYPFGLAMKLCLDPGSGEPDCRFAARQFQELREAFDSMRRRGDVYRISEPVAFIPEAAAILMEWVPGETFTAILKQRTRTTAEVIAVARSAGAWLRQFHDAGASELAPPDPAALQSEIDGLAGRLDAGSGFHATMQSALGAAARALPVLGTMPLQTARLHGDWQPANVVVGPNGVYGLDISFSQRGFALLDAAHMVSHMRRFPLPPKGWHRYPARRAMVQAFVASYLGERPGRQERLALHWFELLDQVRFFLRYYGREPTRPRNWYLGAMQSALVVSARRRMEALIGA